MLKKEVHILGEWPVRRPEREAGEQEFYSFCRALQRYPWWGRLVV